MTSADEQTEVMRPASSAEADPERPHWSWGRRLLVASAVVLVAGGAGTGAYLYGKSTGEDLDEARAEGAAAGQEEGAAMGAEQGYAQGFEEGRAEAFEESYAEAYRRAYTEAFEEAGLEPPTKVKVEAPEP